MRTSPLGATEGAQPTQPAADFWAPELCGVQRTPIRPFLQQFPSFYEEDGWYSDMNQGESALSLGNAPSSMNMGCPSVLSEIHFSAYSACVQVLPYVQLLCLHSYQEIRRCKRLDPCCAADIEMQPVVNGRYRSCS